MREETITLAIFEKYTPEELATTAQQMAQAQSDYETVESEKKVSDAAFNERLKKHAVAVSELAKKYNKGGETAQIGCDIRYDHPEPGKKSYFRMDRGELVETHDMTWEERQETIQFPLAEQPAPEPNVSDISTAELEKLAAAPAPEKCQEEVTASCQQPGCTLFAHDGDHEFSCGCPIAFPEDPKLRSQVHRIECQYAPKPKRQRNRPGAILPDTPKDPPAPGVQP